MKSSRATSKRRLATTLAFRGDLIRPGDVLLCTSPDDKTSGTIRAVTRGAFSHAAICTKPPLFIEADFPGVTEFSLDRKLLANFKNARILRLKPSVPRAAEIAKIAAKAALNYQTGKYDKIAAVASVFGGAKATSGLFCSYVVAAAYQFAGLNITPKGKPAARTTPADIQGYKGFNNITRSLLVQAKLDQHSTYFFLDRSPQYPIGEPDLGEVPSPAQLYNIALRITGERVSQFLKNRGRLGASTFMEAQKALLSCREEPWFRELDKLFASSIRELALPEIVKAAPIVAKGRQRDVDALARALANLNHTEHDSNMQIAYIRHRAAATAELIKDRLATIRSFEHDELTTGWESYSARLECERLLCDILRENLASHREQFDRIRQHAQSKAWSID